MKKIGLGIDLYRNIIFRLLLTVPVLLTPVLLFAEGSYKDSGSGEANDPYILKTADHIIELSNETSFTHRHYRLDADIDMSGVEFKKIGGDNGFVGDFNGNNHKISNVTYISETEDYVGFFSKVSNSSIYDITFENVNIKGQSFVGGVAGSIGNTSLRNILVSGRVEAVQSIVGGIAGYIGNSADIVTIQNYADVYAECKFELSMCSAGGVFGSGSGCKVNCALNKGRVEAEYKCYVGGVMGYAVQLADIYSSVNVGEVSGMEYVGGVVGYSSGGMIQKCINAGSVSSNSDSVSYLGGVCGNLVGYRSANCLNSGLVKGAKKSSFVGGCFGSFIPNNTGLGATVNVGAFFAIGDSLGSVVGYRKCSDASNTYYDTTLSVISDKEAFGLSLNDLTSAKRLYELGSDWTQLDSFLYPIPNMNNGNEVYEVPDDFDEILYFASLPVPFDSVSADKKLMSQFELYPVDGITYSSSTGCLQIKGHNVGLAKVGDDTLFINYKNSRRVIPVYVGTVDTLLFSGGKGTNAKPYVLTTIGDVRKLAEMVNEEVAYDDASKNWSNGKYFYLANDIAESVDFVIGNCYKGDEFSFQGYFDGGGHSLSLYIDSTSSASLFGVVGKGAEIKSLSVIGSVAGGDFVSGVCGILKGGTLRGCYNGASVHGSGVAGGVCASAEDGSVIIGCANSGTIKGSDLVGGLVGSVKGGSSVVDRCLNSGYVEGTGFVGGVAGMVEDAVLSGSVAVGSVGGASAGVVCGASSGTVASSFFDSRMSMTGDEFAAGVVTDSLLGDKILNRFETDASKWVFETGCYALPAELKGVKDAKLASYCLPIDSKDCVGDVSFDFSILDGLGLSWTSLGGNVRFEEGMAYLSKCGSDTLKISLKDKQERIFPVLLTYPIFSGGRGTAEEPYIIKVYDDMKFLEELVNTNRFGRTSSENWSEDKIFKVVADIADTIKFVIGDGRAENAYFGGEFNGLGHEFILNIDSLNKGKSNEPVGLFGTMKNGKVDSVRVSGYVKGKDCVGGICGYSYNSQINASVNSASILGNSYVGGICGLAKGNYDKNKELFNLSSALNIGYVAGDSCVGGIVGKTDSCGVKMLVNTGVVSAELDYVGGVAGVALGGTDASRYDRVFNFGSFKVAKEKNKCYGAICGEFDGRMISSYYDGQMTSKLLGGVKGNDYDNLNNIHAVGIPTKTLVGGSLFSDMFFSVDMTHKDGFYPCPTAIASFPEAKLAVTPVILKGDEFIGLIKSDFSVSDSLGVSFSALHDCFSTNATNATLRKPGDEVVCLRLGKYVKNLNAFIANGLFSGGNGTEENPYLIKTKKDMEDLASLVNQNTLQTVYGRNWSYGNYFSLQNDILDDTIETIVGENLIGADSLCFDGVFYGNGYSLNVKIEREADYVGVFGILGVGTVDSLFVEGEVSGTYFVGGICGLNRYGKVKGCVNNSRVRGAVYVGGVLGYNRNEISYSGNSGRVSAETEYVGGVLGVNVSGATISRSVNAGSVFSSGNAIGGVVGSNAGHVLDCLNSGFISQGTKVGGICGEVLGDSNCLLKNCLNAGVVYSSRNTDQIGAIYGYFEGTGGVEDCYSDSQMCLAKTEDGMFPTEGLLASDLFAHWLHADSLYPRPFDSELTLLAAAPVFFDEADSYNSIDSAFYFSKPDSLQWSSVANRFVVSGEKADLLRKGNDTIRVTLNGMLREVPVQINCVTIRNSVSWVGCDSFVYESDNLDFVAFSDTSFVDSLKNDGCDSLLLVDIKISKVQFVDSVINACDSVVFEDVVYTDSTLVKDTLKNVLECDSVITFTYLNVYKTNKDSLLRIEGCDSVVYDSVVYYDNISLSDTLKSDVCDCDSVIFGVDIVVNKTQRSPFDVKGCGAASYNGETFYSDTSFVDSLKTKSGCDSLVYVNVVIGKETRNEISKSACDSLFYTNSKGVRIKYTESVVFNDTLVNSKGCDSILTVNVNILKSDYTMESVSACERYRYIDTIKQRDPQGRVSETIVDEYILKDTVIRYDLKNENLCDSIHEIHIKITKPSYHDYTVWGCDSVKLENGSVFYKDTVYEERFECDSIRRVNIEVYNTVYDTLVKFGCESVDFEGVTYYKDTVLNRVIHRAEERGCDTFRTINIKVANPIEKDTVITGCGFVEYEGRLFETDEELYEVIESSQGCDSLVHIVRIKILNQKTSTDTIEGCDSVFFKDNYYKENTILTETHKSADGCDSIVEIHLNVVKPVQVSRVEKGCDSLLYNGKTYFSDTTLVEHYTSSKGCDSVVYVNVEIGHSGVYSERLASCGRVKFDGEYFYSDTSFVRVYANMEGCDSIVNVDIDVWEISNTEIFVDSMNQVTYDEKVYFRSTVLRDTLTNSMGCDSFVTIFINVEKSLDVPLIVNKHDYVLFCNNNIFEEKFVAYQWLKNGVPVAGATKEYYTEEVLLKGCFQVYVTTEAGKEFASETICFEEGREFKLYPNPVAVGENIVVDYEFTEEEMFNLLVEVFNSKGVCVYRGEPSSYPIVIAGRTEPGYYYILITTGKGDNLGERFIVK